MIPLSPRIAAVLSLVAMLANTPAWAQAPPKLARIKRQTIDQGANDPRLKGYLTPEGVRLEVVAEAPAVVNPIALAFGDDGTPYVIEWCDGEARKTTETLTFKDGSKHTIPVLTKNVKDVVKVLHDTVGKGVYDQAKVLLEEDLPSGLLLHDGWLYLSGRGTVRRYRLSALGRSRSADVKPEIIAQGFGGVGHHQVSGLTIGNDGWLYISSGAADNYVEGCDGSRATVQRTGAVFRCRPDGSHLHVFALGFCNPYRQVAFDAWDNVFHRDNDGENDRFRGCRLLYVAEGCDFGWRQQPGARGCQPDPFRTAVKGELPGKMAPLRNTGPGAASGLFIYNDTRFPEPYRGLLYVPDVARKQIRAYRVEPMGATFTVTDEFTFLQSDDPLFRPCQVTVGPDGAMYVVDWRTVSSGGGRLTGDGVHGRFYRVSWSGTKEHPALPPRSKESWLKVIRQSDDDLLKTLGSADGSDRARARWELMRRGERNRTALLALLCDNEQPLTARLAALGILESLWNGDVQRAMQQILAHGEDPLRRRAAEALGFHAAKGDAGVHESLLRALNDSSLSLRRTVALAMAQVAAPGAADALVNTLAFDDSDDVYLRDGLIRAIEGLGKPGIERLLAVAESGVTKDTQRVVDFFAALRTRPGYQGLPALLKYPHLTVAQRAKLIRSCGNYLLNPPISLDPIVTFLAGPEGQAAEVRRAAEGLLAARPDAPKKRGQ